MHSVTIAVADPASSEARALIALLDAYHVDLYPAESNHLLSIEELQQPNVTFVMAWMDGQAAGCGAFVRRDADYAEIKRMYVLPKFRGMKLGRRILEDLERRIAQSGLALARLETGIYQTEALGLYQHAGYVRRGPFGEYAEDPLSVFMEKKLA